ncbi:MAG: ABC transporter permease [Gammaproteobacteria bacterium]|nr:ABC transporter permease [Gammaproteobacteria bacterium]
MKKNSPLLHSLDDWLSSPDKSFEWPYQAMREKNWLEAIFRWSVLRKAYPEHPAVWCQASAVYIELGELDKAEELLVYARQHFPNNPNTFVQSADIKCRQKKWREADVLLSQAREFFPNVVSVWVKSAEYALHQGDADQFDVYSEQVRLCSLNQNLPDPFIQYAELAMKANQWEKALGRWMLLRKNFPDLPVGYLRAAEASRKLGRSKEARQLTLAQQYGTNISDDFQNNERTLIPHVGHTNVGGLIELIWTKAKFNLRSEVHRNYLSYGWWVLEPLMYMIVYYVVFGLLLSRGGQDYPVFLLTGLVPWMWFMKAVSTSSGSILSGQNLMLQVGLPSIVFPLVSILQATIKQLPVFILLLGFVWLQGNSPSIHWWVLIPVVIVQLLLVMVSACVVAAVIPFIRDLSYLVPTGLTFLMFMSGIFYDYRNISEEWQDVFLLNPMAFLLKCYREILMDGISPDLVTLAWWGAGSVTACFMLLLLYQKLRYIFPRVVME